MYAMRRWSVRQARLLDSLYGVFEKLLIASDPLLTKIGYEHLERPVAAVERLSKGFFFDCRMCGQCGGVRADGNCEVIPAMRCVWIEAHEGNLRIGKPNRHATVHTALDNRLWRRSSWLRIAREHAKRAPV